MGERVTVSYRGAAYELGRGKRYYGIWAAGEPRSEPVERWPETPEGWVAAWTRFTTIEAPGTIAPVGQHQVPSQSGAFSGTAAGGDTLAFGRQAETSGQLTLGTAGHAFAAALLAIGVICGLVGLFTHYQIGQSLASQPAQLVPHVAYLAVWTLGGLLIALRAGAVARAGALLAVGTSVVTFGLFLADLGAGLSVADAGLWISLVGWLACTAGAAVAFLITVSKGTTLSRDALGQGVNGRGVIGRPGPRGIVRAALLVAAAVGAVLTFVPNWDSYLGLAVRTGQSQVVGQGYAFANGTPVWVQIADVAIMVLFVLVVAVAALWRPLAAGAMLLAGAIVPLGAQAVSAVVQSSEPSSPLIFGLSASQAQTIGLRITSSLTPAFWLFCLFMLVLLVSCAWMLISPPDRVQVGSVPAADAGPATEPEPAAEPEVAEPEPAAAPMHEAWSEPELAADRRDDRA